MRAPSCSVSGLALWFPTPCGPWSWTTSYKWARVGPRGGQSAGNMASSLRALLCVLGLLAPGALATSPQFGSDERPVHSVGPVIPRVSPRVPPRVHRRLADIRSTEQSSDEAPSAESFREVRLAASNHLTQDGRAADSGGRLVDEICPVRSLTASVRLPWMRALTL